jgi:carbon-monoxide dehydrogenase medium subunit
VARRRGDYAMMGIAVAVTFGTDGVCSDARLAYCSAGETPIFAAKAAQTLVGWRLGDPEVKAAAAAAAREIQPLGGVHASADYQRHLAGVLTRRALSLAKQRAGA